MLTKNWFRYINILYITYIYRNNVFQYNPVENVTSRTDINLRGRTEFVAPPTAKISGLFLSALIGDQTKNSPPNPNTLEDERLAETGLVRERFEGEYFVVQGDIKGFTNLGETVSRVPVSKSILGHQGNEFINQIIHLRAQGSNIISIADAAEQAMDDVATARQLVGRAQSKSVKRVREVAEMMSRVHDKVMEINEVRRQNGQKLIIIQGDTDILSHIGQNKRIGSEGDMLRYLCPDAQTVVEVGLVYGQVLTQEIEVRKLPLDFRIAITKLGDKYIDVYTDPKTKKVWTTSGPGITKCSKAEEQTTPGRISISSEVVDQLTYMPFSNVGEGEVFEIIPGNERSLIGDAGERVHFENVNALPIPVAYCKLRIPDDPRWPIEKVLPNLKIVCEEYGLKWIKPNTTPQKDGSIFVSFICTAEGQKPMTKAIDALKRLGEDCKRMGDEGQNWGGIFGLSYGPACLLVDEDGNIEDIISPTANRTARAAALQQMPQNAIVISLDEIAKSELLIEGQEVLVGEDVELAAKGIKEPLICTRYLSNDLILISKGFDAEVEMHAANSPISFYITDLLYKSLEAKGYNILDAENIIQTVLLYSGIKEVIDRNERLSIRRDSSNLGERERSDTYKIRDLKYLTEIVLSFLDTLDQSQNLPPVTNLLNVLSLHVFHLEYIHNLMQDLSEEELHALTLLSSTSLGRFFPVGFETPFDAFDIDPKIINSLKDKGLIYFVTNDHKQQIFVRPGVSQLCDWACEPQLREAIHEEIGKLQLKRIDTITVPNNEWYRVARILLLHQMNTDIDELADNFEKDQITPNFESKSYIDKEYRAKLVRVIHTALQYASDKKLYTDLVMFSEAFAPLYRQHPAWALELRLKYGFSHFSMNNIDEAINIFNDISLATERVNLEPLDSQEVYRLNQVRMKTELYCAIATLKRNHLFIPTRLEMVRLLRENYLGNEYLIDDQLMIYEFLRDNTDEGLTDEEKAIYYQLKVGVQFI